MYNCLWTSIVHKHIIYYESANVAYCSCVNVSIAWVHSPSTHFRPHSPIPENYAQCQSIQKNTYLENIYSQYRIILFYALSMFCFTIFPCCFKLFTLYSFLELVLRFTLQAGGTLPLIQLMSGHTLEIWCIL